MSTQCILDSFGRSSKWSCRELDEIENHISSTSTCCYHPPLKDLVLTGKLAGSTPLLMACRDGQFKSVKRIVNRWGADVNRTAVYYSTYQYGNK